MHASTRISLGLIAGIWALRELHPWGQGPWLSLSSLLFLALIGLIKGPAAGRFRPLKLVLVALFLGATSMSLALDQQRLAQEAHSSQLDDRDDERLCGYVQGPVERYADRQHFVLQTASAAIWMTVYGEQGSEAPPIVPGSELEIVARLSRPIGLRAEGASDRRAQIMARGAQLIASASSAELRILGRRSTAWYWAGRAHDWAVERIESRPGSQRGRALVAAIATGERAGISTELAAGLRVAGIAHLLAVSGMHLAAVVSLVFVVVRWLWAWLPARQRAEPQAVAAGLALVAALAFTAITGARPSTCRALLVAVFVLGGILLHRRIRLLHALAWAASMLLLWRPVLLWDVGFQMSFAAALALALAFRPRESSLVLQQPKRWQRVGRAALDLIKASFWACMATAPLSLYHFGEFSWIGLVTNLVAVPLATFLLLPCALGGLLFEALTGWGGKILLDFAIALAECMATASHWVYEQRGMVARSPLDPLELLLWAFLCALLLPGARTLSVRRRWMFVALSVSTLLASRAALLPWQGERVAGLRVSFVEVGQGDATLLETPGGQVWLIDGGGLPFVSQRDGVDAQYIAESPARQALLPLLRHRRIDHIDLAIVSHPHPDHFVGLQAVARVMPIRELWTVHQSRPGPYETWLEELRAAGTLVRAPTLGLARAQGGVSVHVLWPRYGAERGGLRAAVDPILSVNDNSLVLRIDYAGRRLLFAGDVEEEAEELLVLRSPDELAADLIKVPHHGSKTSSSPALVRATRALVAVVSCGRANRFGFPDASVQERWRRATELYLRTDQVGTVTLSISPSGTMRLKAHAPF